MILGFVVDLVVDQTARRLARSGCKVRVYTTRSELDPADLLYRIATTSPTRASVPSSG